MKSESGSKNSPVYLIGDSSPKHWANELDSPLESKHPARHNIWTPILENIQANLYRTNQTRLYTDDFYVRNAIHNASDKPHNSKTHWSRHLGQGILKLSDLIEKYSPKLMFSFGSFAFEFTRRSLHEYDKHPFRHWSTKRLGDEFRRRVVDGFTPHKVNLVPLLHVSIARRHFLRSHEIFTQKGDANYFEFVGYQLAKRISENMTEFPFE